MEKLPLLLVLLVLGLASVASAHEYVLSGTGSLVVHMEPGHVAVAKEPVVINVNIQNTEPGFALQKCNCELTIEQNGQQLLSVPLVPAKKKGEFDVEGIPFTFPNAGEYHLKVRAEPVAPNQFAPFGLEVHGQVLPVGSPTPADTGADEMVGSSMHMFAHPRLILTEAAVFTLVMGYFLFSNTPLIHPRKKKVAR